MKHYCIYIIIYTCINIICSNHLWSWKYAENKHVEKDDKACWKLIFGDEEKVTKW